MHATAVHVAPAAMEVPKLTNRQVLAKLQLQLIDFHIRRKDL